MGTHLVMTGLDVAIEIVFTALDAMHTALLQINPLEYSDRTAMLEALRNSSVKLETRQIKRGSLHVT
jgi:hypothetical protein